jgi:acyl-CoA thioesterase FadM
MDLARSALFRSRGLDIGDIADLDLRMMVVDAACRYTYPLRYGEHARVSAWIARVDNRIRVAYEIWNVTQERSSARAHTLLITTDAAGKLLWQTPAVVRRRLLPHTS